ncbi:hypothetical protein [Sphingobium sp. YR768]|uniref:hypothetical protein n=1 Tax=Sphingobium sp. YR768 TaxID=1884365 RepID=UPI0008BC7959|nr:hypothetical protein SAMN05518866_15019 [Sphingobium sp. YR768]
MHAPLLLRTPADGAAERDREDRATIQVEGHPDRDGLLGVDIGFKCMHVLRRGHNYLPAPQSEARRSSFAALVSQGKTVLKNEYLLSQELGYHYIGTNLSFSLTTFHYHFRNRQAATAVESCGALVNSAAGLHPVPGEGQLASGFT